ncbi:hypothetical protein C2E23DRAFT_838312, partial [Lenzites betulinus]
MCTEAIGRPGHVLGRKNTPAGVAAHSHGILSAVTRSPAARSSPGPMPESQGISYNALMRPLRLRVWSAREANAEEGEADPPQIRQISHTVSAD